MHFFCFLSTSFSGELEGSLKALLLHHSPVDASLLVPQATKPHFLLYPQRITNTFGLSFTEAQFKKKKWVIYMVHIAVFLLLSKNIMETVSRGHGNHLMKDTLTLQMRGKNELLRDT